MNKRMKFPTHIQRVEAEEETAVIVDTGDHSSKFKQSLDLNQTEIGGSLLLQ